MIYQKNRAFCQYHWFLKLRQPLLYAITNSLYTKKMPWHLHFDRVWTLKMISQPEHARLPSTAAHIATILQYSFSYTEPENEYNPHKQTKTESLSIRISSSMRRDTGGAGRCSSSTPMPAGLTPGHCRSPTHAEPEPVSSTRVHLRPARPTSSCPGRR
jgi:hypothetical protein